MNSDLMKEAKRILESLDYYDIGRSKDSGWFVTDAETLAKALADAEKRGREDALEEALSVVKEGFIRGEYKDCPAAWMNDAFKNFEKKILSIRSRQDKGRGQ